MAGDEKANWWFGGNGVPLKFVTPSRAISASDAGGVTTVAAVFPATRAREMGLINVYETTLMFPTTSGFVR